MKLDFPHKLLRARVVADWVARAGYRGVVCFGSGNAARELRAAGLYCIDVSRSGQLEARRWWSPEEIHRAWPDLLDATPGHLPAPLMVLLASAYGCHLGGLARGVQYAVPTGSGETILCLRIAYPGYLFVAEYDDAELATRYDAEAPLNGWVAALFPVIFTAPKGSADACREDRVLQRERRLRGCMAQESDR